MCGIAGYIGSAGAAGDTAAARARVERQLDSMTWRGPDGRGCLVGKGGALGHVRLAIIDPAGGQQPLSNPEQTLWIALNGEVYNHRELRTLVDESRLRTTSDTEVVLHLFEREGPAMLRRLLGMYACAIWDRQGRLFLARDPIGIKPLYWGRDRDGAIVFASEIKAMLRVTDDFAEFPPGHYFLSGQGLQPFYHWQPNQRSVTDPAAAIDLITRRLEEGIERCLVSDVPVGVFLSGGLDSSLVAAIARRRYGPGLKSFAVGMVGSADLFWARQVAAYLGTDHHEYAYTPAEVEAALPAVIYHLESYDPPLVRSAVATWMCGRLAAQHVKVVLTGEGADELFAGYHYLKEYGSRPQELAGELYRITRRLHNSNLQRADRETMAHSVEARVPFLEVPVVEAAFTLSPGLLLGPDGKTEKWVLRKVAEQYLPNDCVWRKKEKFSLGTGTGQYLEQLAARQVSEAAFRRERRLPWGDTLHTREEVYYWRHFSPHYGYRAVVERMGRSRTLGDYELNPAAWVAGV